MIAPVLSLLSKLKLSHILILTVIALAIGLTHFRSKYISEQETSKIRQDNYYNILKLHKENDSMKVIQLKFQSQIELEKYVEQTKDLKDLLNKQGIDKNKVNSLIYSQQKFIDSLKKTFNANTLIDNIQQEKDGIFDFKDDSKCINVEGNVEYKDGNLSVNITKKEVTSKFLITEYKGRRKNIKWLFGLRLGKRDVKKAATTDCGNVDVQIIEKVE